MDWKLSKDSDSGKFTGIVHQEEFSYEHLFILSSFILASCLSCNASINIYTNDYGRV